MRPNKHARIFSVKQQYVVQWSSTEPDEDILSLQQGEVLSIIKKDGEDIYGNEDKVYSIKRKYMYILATLNPYGNM